mmetsp:Transcript_29297/g.79298  ORF Transcript_29297/g.79298 Transcript_29297/m.79298 type:complete len:246 (+) Transcript_29297:409-1146(+)|eukprot:CAMPEP_0172361130 /NCGR_PEP_ID=MMETSP1060-20121228/5017_1 /TAXON_ID=37318 /ORGANISM="Pseudo-nitzschia pungens, Strain cf. cingulata" /LENGTH=245 /DNA_ID=CAMNT_0013083299 /DNA_START=337 /DNA_END=1074 /DNA_ORIENTATION=+
MSDAAAKSIVQAAAPGQLDAVADNLEKLAGSGGWKAETKKEAKEFQCVDLHVDGLDHPLAKPLHEKIEQYQKDNYLGKPGVTARVAMTKDDHNQLVVHTYAEKIDVPNQYAANWKATWTIDSVELGVGDIYGRVVVHSCAHENGNVQLKINKEFPSVTVGKTALKDGDEPSLVDGLVEQITKWETIILGILESMNDSISSDHLKSIRRVLPITKTKMNWNVVAHQSVNTLKKSAPEARSKVKYNN